MEPTLVPMVDVVVLSLLVIGSGQGEAVSGTLPAETVQAPGFALDGPSWKPWELQGKQVSRARPSMPSATVEVVESQERERQSRLLEFKARTAPLLWGAYDVGYAARTNVQMLTEFMLQDPAHPHPPTVPSVFYNNFKPPPENPAFQVQSGNGWSRFWVAVRKEPGPAGR